MRLKTLGRAAVEGSDFLRPKPLLFLAYLAVEGPRDRRHLRELFWPDAADAGLSLRVLLSQTRSALPGVVVEEHHQLGLGIPSDVADLLEACKSRSRGISLLYPGAFLGNLTVPGLGSELEEWILLTREFLACQVRAHLILEAETLATGNLTLAAELAEQAWSLKGAPPVEIDDLQRLYQVLSAAQHGLSAILREEARGLRLELQPSADRGEPQPLQRTGGTRSRPGLPKVANAFIGRAAELEDLHRLLSDPDIRLLTLLGPGGIGKTRLALETARISPVEQVFFVPLDALQQSGEVAVSIARAMGIDLAGHEDVLDVLRRKIGTDKVLLVLDNFEHLLPAGMTVSSLLEACDKLTVIVTSRERLNLDWEFVYPLTGLDTGADEQGDAVRLFTTRARKADGRFRLTSEARGPVVEICRRVGGSPLAIELAAAWVRTLSVE